MLRESPDANKHLQDLPGEAHIVSGKLVGDGEASLASSAAHLSGKVVKLERTSDGGVAYQFAIYVSEPIPNPVLAAKEPENPRFLAAVEYFVSKGKDDGDARKLVNEFGVERVLARREKELDEQLERHVSE